jgi:[NiFe] hydrogenase assembly HybE family chaperone
MTEIESRIAELVARFRQIGATQMRDLPIYNACLDVEAVGFQALGKHWVGVLITPWFMSAILLPSNKTALDNGTLGQTSVEVLPSATHTFMSGGIETVGGYKSLSIHSPMGAFTSQEDARHEARVRLTALLTPSAEIPKDAPTTPRASPQPAPDLQRRAFLGVIGNACQTKE